MTLTRPSPRKIPLSPKAFDLLCALLERRPNVVDKAALLARIWPATHVVDANLNVLIGEIRQALSDKPQSPLYIRTVHRVGFAFCGEALDLEPEQFPEGHGESGRFWLVWNDRTFVLSEGSNVIGRDPKSEVWLDAAGVSRQHARIRVNGAARSATLEDMKSTNGTFLQRSRVGDRVSLSDGDLIKVGPLELRFKTWFADTPRPTERIRHRPRS